MSVIGMRCPDIGGLDVLKGSLESVPPKDGSPAVIEMWASWCGPCRQVFPHLSETARKYKAKGLKVIGITSEQRAQVSGFVQQMDGVMHYTVACDSRQECQAKLAAPAGVRGIPHAFVVGGDGLIKYSGHPMDPGFSRAVDIAVKEANPVRMEPIPVITASRDELMAMSIKELKGILTLRKIPLAGLFEKGDIVSKILELCTGDVTYFIESTARGPQPPSAAASAESPAVQAQRPKNVVCEDGVCRMVPPGEVPSTEGAEALGPEAPQPAAHAPSDDLTAESDLSSLKISEMKAALKARGVSLAGLAEKGDLVAALKTALSA